MGKGDAGELRWPRLAGNLTHRMEAARRFARTTVADADVAKERNVDERVDLFVVFLFER